MSAKIKYQSVASILFGVLLIGVSKAQDPWWEESGWHDLYSNWQTAFAGSRQASTNFDDVVAMENATEALREWRASREQEFINKANLQQAGVFELMDFRLAQAWANASEYNKALNYLRKETEAYVESNGGFLANTRNPSAFAQDVFVLHSEIMAHTGNVTVPPGAGYKVFDVSSENGPPSFAFVFEPVENDEGGVAIEGVAEDEQRQVIDLSAQDEAGRYKITDRAQVIGQRDGVVISAQLANGKPSLRLRGISKFVEYKGDLGVPIVRQSPVSSLELAVDRGKIEQPSDAAKIGRPDAVADDGNPPSSRPSQTGANSPPSPQSSAPKKTLEAKPAPASGEEPASTTQWSIIVVLILAALGLLWRLLKKRK